MSGTSPGESLLALDIGGATTDIACYLDGTLQHTAVMPVGGSHITNDIIGAASACGLR